MTNPEADFGDALRRALSGAAEVTPPDGEALRRIRARARVRTPRRRLQSALAVLIPWHAFRLLQYRTLVADLLRDGAARAHLWLAASGRWLEMRGARLVVLSSSARRWLTVRGLPALGQATSIAWSRGQPLVARIRPAVRGLTSRVTSSSGGTHAPRHADPAPPVSNIGWLRPALAAAAVAFVATLAVTVGPVRQAIVNLGSSVISTGHTQSGNSGGSVNGTGHNVPGPATPTPIGTVVTSSPRPTAKPSATTRSSCGASSPAKQSSACPTSSASPPVSVASTPAASASASASPSASPSPSAPPSASASATNTSQAVSAPGDQVSPTP